MLLLLRGRLMNTKRSEESRRHIFAGLPLAILIAGFLIGQLARPQSTPYSPRGIGPAPRSQSADARLSFFSKKPVIAGVIKSSEAFNLFHPRTLRSDSLENIFVVDGGIIS